MDVSLPSPLRLIACCCCSPFRDNGGGEDEVGVVDVLLPGLIGRTSLVDEPSLLISRRKLKNKIVFNNLRVNLFDLLVVLVRKIDVLWFD